jgi:hypothetical protein
VVPQSTASVYGTLKDAVHPYGPQKMPFGPQGSAGGGVGTTTVGAGDGVGANELVGAGLVGGEGETIAAGRDGDAEEMADGVGVVVQLVRIKPEKIASPSRDRRPAWFD